MAPSGDGSLLPRRNSVDQAATSAARASLASPSRNGRVSPSRSPPPPSTPPGAPGRAPSPTALPVNMTQGSVKAALLFVKRLATTTTTRKPPPTTNPAQPASGADGDGASSGSSAPDGAAASQAPLAVITETETIEPAAPGSTVAGASSYEEPLDALVSPPLLERNAVSEYIATAENWLMTDRMLEQHEEFMARGLLMIRNVVRSDPRYAAQESGNWMPVVRDSLNSKHGLVRSSAASALAAFAASTPGREAIHKDSLVLPRLMQMLTSGLIEGGDNNDTQYSCLALSNIALNACSRQQLSRHSALPRAADVLRAAIRYFNTTASSGASAATGTGSRASVTGTPPRAGKNAGGGAAAAAAGGGGGGAAGGGSVGVRKSASSLLKSATYMATMMTSWAVEPSGRGQLQQYGVPRLASDLHERCCAAMGEEHPLCRRLVLLADTSSAAELLEEIAEVGGAPGLLSWEVGLEDYSGGAGAAHPNAANPHAAMLRGVSFVEGSSRGMTRASAAMNSLHRIMEAEPGGGGGSRGGTATGVVAAGGGGGMNRSMSKLQLGGLAPASSITLPGTAAAAASSAPPSPAAATTTTTTITATTTTTTTAASSAPLSPSFLSPRDPTGSGTPRLGQMLSGPRTSQPGPPLRLDLSVPLPQPSSHNNTNTNNTSSASQLITSPFGTRQAAFSETGFHRPSSGLTAPSTPTSQQQPSPVSTGGLSSGGSMLGVHFSASIFQEAAAAAAAARGGRNDDDSSWQRRSPSAFLTQLNSQSSAASKTVRLPSVATGGGGGSRGSALVEVPLAASSRSVVSAPLSARGGGSADHHHQQQQRQGGPHLPFHLVRPIPTISASSSVKISRISAAYGNVSNATGPSGGGSSHQLNSYPRGYTGQL